MVSDLKTEEPVWVKYITEDNLPTDDLKYLCSIIGIEATKKLMINAAGEKFSIHAHCNQSYKRQYIIDNYNATRKNIIELAMSCDTTDRFVYKVIEEHVKNKNIKNNK